MARTGCVHCSGLGMLPEGLCRCVYRACFRCVMNKVRECAIGGHLRPIIYEGASGPRGRSDRGRKRQEYCADVYLCAKRTLQNQVDWDLFRFHYLLSADWKLCARRMGLNRERKQFFDLCYRIEERLGKVFMELAPFALWPVDEYFSITDRPVDVSPFPVPEPRYPNGQPLRPPLLPCVPVPLRRAGGRPPHTHTAHTQTASTARATSTRAHCPGAHYPGHHGRKRRAQSSTHLVQRGPHPGCDCHCIESLRSGNKNRVSLDWGQRTLAAVPEETGCLMPNCRNFKIFLGAPKPSN
jgi:hypothetical protein